MFLTGNRAFLNTMARGVFMSTVLTTQSAALIVGGTMSSGALPLMISLTGHITAYCYTATDGSVLYAPDVVQKGDILPLAAGATITADLWR